MRNVPVESVTAVRSPWSCGLVAVTVTPGRTAPCGSTTVPMIWPVVWAPANRAVNITSATAHHSCFHLMCVPSFCHLRNCFLSGTCLPGACHSTVHAVTIEMEIITLSCISRDVHHRGTNDDLTI